MRFKYYMRGLGCGVILATLLFTIGNHFGSVAKDNEAAVVEEEVVSSEEAAEESTEIVPEDVPEDLPEDVPEVQPEEETDSTDDVEVTEEEPTDVTVKYVSFTVHGGDSSEIVSSNLYKAGIIDSVDNFNKYLKTVGVDHKIQAGTFYVKEDSSYDDLAALLVNKEARTTTPPKDE